jgi:hypothetical protein
VGNRPLTLQQDQALRWRESVDTASKVRLYQVLKIVVGGLAAKRQMKAPFAALISMACPEVTTGFV